MAAHDGFRYTDRVWQYAEAHGMTYNQARMSPEFKALWKEHQRVIKEETRGSKEWVEHFDYFYDEVGLEEWDEEGFYHYTA